MTQTALDRAALDPPLGLDPELKTQNSKLKTRQSPVLVAAVAGLFYLGLLTWLWGHFQGDPLGFVHIGTFFTQHDPNGTRGYDGQFYYFTAIDPLHAADLMQGDNATFRLQRIFFPMVMYIVALGQPALVPYAMLLINWLAVVGGTLLVALLLRRWGRSPWFALCFAGASGIPVALTFDTAEPLTFALVALGVWYWDRSGPRTRRAALAGLLALAAALLTRELAGYFVAAYAGAALFRRDWRLLLLAGAAFVPSVAWDAYLSLTSNYLGVSYAQPFEYIPFIAYWLQLGNPTLRSVALAGQYIIPAVVFGVLAIWQGLRTWRAPAALLFATLGNVHLMTFVPRGGYFHQIAVSRYALGLALAAVLWAGSSRPRWLLWLTLLFLVGLLAYFVGLVRQDPAYLW